MDFRFTAEDEAFRNEVRSFIEAELPPNWDDVQDVRESESDYEEQEAFKKKLAAKGWFAMAWPKEYGGQDASIFQQMIFSEITAWYGAPAGGQGVAWVGPAILLYGNDEQKQHYLPKITSAEIDFCTLYTEPDAGSDLASLQCSAVRDGDDYVINGHKVFNGNADLSDYGWLAARTDPEAPKHRGISLFIVDMKTPGVTVSPMRTMADTDFLQQVHFDNARIPAANLVGEENRGWYQMAVSLDFERSGAGRVSRAARVLQEMVEYARTTERNGRPLSQDPAVRTRLARLAMEIEVARYLSYRVASLQGRGQPFNYEASIAKVYGTELSLRVQDVALDLMGMHGLLRKGSNHAPFNGRYAYESLNAWGNMFGAGTSEIQRTIIATRGLGLPRE